MTRPVAKATDADNAAAKDLKRTIAATIHEMAGKPAEVPTPTHVVSMVVNPMTHELIVLTKEGEMFERVADSRHFSGNFTKKFLWRKIPGPEVGAYETARG